ncbi:hypothetical protein Tco_1126805, partial [Tanacetum coccineum]
MAYNFMDQVIRAKVGKDAYNKIKWKDDQRRNSGQNKRHEVVKAYAAGSSDKKSYVGTLPLCDKCKFHHHRSPCPAPYENYKKPKKLVRTITLLQ